MADAVPNCLRPLSEQLFSRPLQAIEADHARQLELCALIERLIDQDEPDRRDGEILDRIASFLGRDLRLPLADVEEGHFPRLRSRCDPEEIKMLLGLLFDEYSEDEQIVEALRGEFEAGLWPTPEGWARFREPARRFVPTRRRRLAWENDILLPLAGRPAWGRGSKGARGEHAQSAQAGGTGRLTRAQDNPVDGDFSMLCTLGRDQRPLPNFPR